MRDEVKRTVTCQFLSSSCVSSVVLSGWGRSVPDKLKLEEVQVVVKEG